MHIHMHTYTRNCSACADLSCTGLLDSTKEKLDALSEARESETLDLKSELARTKSDLLKVKCEIDNKNSDIESKNAEIGKVNEMLAQLMAQAKAEVESSFAMVAKLKEELKVATEKLKSAEGARYASQELEEKLLFVEEQRDALREILSESEVQGTQMKAEHDRLMQALEAMQAADAKRRAKDAEVNEERFRDLEQEITTLRQKLLDEDAERVAILEDRDMFRRTSEGLQERNDSLDKRVKDLQVWQCCNAHMCALHVCMHLHRTDAQGMMFAPARYDLTLPVWLSNVASTGGSTFD